MTETRYGERGEFQWVSSKDTWLTRAWTPPQSLAREQVVIHYGIVKSEIPFHDFVAVLRFDERLLQRLDEGLIQMPETEEREGLNEDQANRVIVFHTDSSVRPVSWLTTRRYIEKELYALGYSPVIED